MNIWQTKPLQARLFIYNHLRAAGVYITYPQNNPMIRLISLLFLCSLTLYGCNVDNRVGNTRELSREMKASQIKRVTESQLLSTVNEWGKQLADLAQKALEKELSQKPAKGAGLCDDLNQLPLIAALEKEYSVTIELVGAADLTNPQLTDKEKSLLEAYAYNAKNNLPPAENVQKLNDTLIVYNASLPTESSITKACYERQESPFAVWRILFDKKAVIRQLDARQLKK